MFVLIVLGSFLTCNINESLNDALTLRVWDTCVTEVFLEIEIKTEYHNADLNIYKDGAFFRNVKDLNNKMIIIDSNLTFNTQVSYEAELRISPKESIRSNKIIAQTLSPTNHEFMWQKYYFEIGSVIYDLEIIDEKNIWAVGSIWVLDSLQDLHFYNGLFWDGEKWELKEIPARGSHESNELTSGLVGSIFISGPNDIWFTSGGQMVHWDGSNFGNWTFLFESLSDTSFHGINRLGGIPNNVVWAVGNKGNLFLCHKNLEWGNWEKFGNNITEDLFDVFCIGNDVYLLVANFQDFNKNRIIKINKNNEVTLIESVKTRWFSSLWTENGFPIYLSGDGIFENKNEIWNEINFGTNKVIEKIRGNNLNDIFAVGQFGVVTHFNGIDWQTYPELEMDGVFTSLSIKNNVVAISGIEMGKAVIVIGTRK